MAEHYKSYYAAKFAREAKANPSKWVIHPNGGSGYVKLVRLTA